MLNYVVYYKRGQAIHYPNIVRQENQMDNKGWIWILINNKDITYWIQLADVDWIHVDVNLR